MQEERATSSAAPGRSSAAKHATANGHSAQQPRQNTGHREAADRKAASQPKAAAPKCQPQQNLSNSRSAQKEPSKHAKAATPKPQPQQIPSNSRPVKKESTKKGKALAPQEKEPSKKRAAPDKHVVSLLNCSMVCMPKHLLLAMSVSISMKLV